MGQALRDHRVARFGPFTLEVRAGELLRNGSRVPLQEQPLAILKLLLEHSGDVVTREQLRDVLWESDTFVDFDHGLNAAIAKLRTALRDSAENPLFIETLPRHGYRLIAPVEWTNDQAHTVRRRHPTAWTVAAVLGAVLISIGTMGVLYLRHERPAAHALNSIAILPFATDSRETEYLGDGLAEALIGDLTSWPGIRVISRDSSFRFKGRTIDPRLVARQLDADAIVTGRVQRNRDEYRLQIDMIDSSDGAELWSMSYSTRIADLDQLRLHVSADMALRLGVTRSDTRQRQDRRSPAYDLYLKGRFLSHKLGPDNILGAIACFEKAIEVDPRFAPGHVGLARGYEVLVANMYMPDPDGSYQAKAQAAAARAIELDPTLAEAYEIRGRGAMIRDWDFASAERDLRHAIELDPHLASAHQWYSAYLSNMGRAAEAKREIDIASRLDPFMRGVNLRVCWNRMLDGKYGEAIDFSHQLSATDPKLVNLDCLSWCHLMMGRYEDGIAAITRMSQEDGAALAAAYRDGGSAAFWRKYLEQLEPVDSYRAATAASAAGEGDHAFALLEKAYKTRHPMLTWMYADPRLSALKTDPRFDDLARRIGLPQARAKG